MKKFFVIICILLIIAVVITSVVLSNPLRKSEEQIREDLLELIPIGSDMTYAQEIIRDNSEWELKNVDLSEGYRSQNSSERVGERSIEVYLGEYKNIFETDVTAYLGFDDNFNLVDIMVSKQIHGF